MKRASTLFILLIIGLAGCGQTGPLYLPTQSAKPSSSIQSQQDGVATASKTSQSSRPSRQ